MTTSAGKSLVSVAISRVGTMTTSVGKSLVSVAISRVGTMTTSAGKSLVSVAASATDKTVFVSASLTSLGGAVAISLPDASPL